MDQAKSSTNSPSSIDFFPFAYALYNEYLSDYCWYCLDEEKSHRQCTGCHVAKFCDKNCQILAWKDHKFECKAIKRTTQVPDIEVRLLGRIVVRHKAISLGKDQEDPNFYKDRTSRRNIMDIWAHTKNIRNDSYAIKKFNSIYDRLVQFYESKALLSKEEIFELHCRDFINRHAISDKAYLKEIGKGLYCDLCAYDHSCRPNTIYICDGFKAILKPLHSDVNLLDRSTTFYSYIDLLCAKQARRKLLKDTWYFQCECERCMDNSEHILTSINCPKCKSNSKSFPLCLFGEQIYKDNKTQIITCPECSRTVEQEEVMEALAAMRFIDDVLEKNDFEGMSRSLAVDFITNLLKKFENILPKVNIYYCKLIQALISFIDPADTQNLLNLHLEAEECVRICYPHNHPALGFHLRNIGLFSKGLQQLDQSLKYLEEAESIFSFVMPKDHSLNQSSKAAKKEVEKELQSKSNLQKISTTTSVIAPSTAEAVVNKSTPRFKIQVEQEFWNDAINENPLSNPRRMINTTENEKKDLRIPTIFPSKIIVTSNLQDEKENNVFLRSNSTDSPSFNVPQLLIAPQLLVDEKTNQLKIEINEPETFNSLHQRAHKTTLSPQHDSTGVKKKASLKKFSPRARTPLPPLISSTKESSEEEDKGEPKGLKEDNDEGMVTFVVSHPTIPNELVNADESTLESRSKKKTNKRNECKLLIDYPI